MLLISISILLLNIISSSTVKSDYEVPRASFRLLKPKGFSVSIPDEDGIQLFAFHGNINEPLHELEAGQFSKDILKCKRGRWIFKDNKTKLKHGDVIYYWLFVIKDHSGYRSDLQQFYVNNTEDITTNSPERSQETDFHAPLGQHFDNENDSGYKIAAKVSSIAVDLYEEVKKLREINAILYELINKDETLSKTLRFEGILPGFDDPTYNAQIILTEKLSTNVPIVNATKNSDGSITFSLASLDDKISVIRAAKNYLTDSKIKLRY